MPSTEPQLPVDLFSRIIDNTWSLDLSPPERTALFEANILVSKFWLVEFLRVAGRHIHIMDLRFMHYYFSLVRREPSLSSLLNIPPLKLDYRCRSVTIIVANQAMPPDRTLPHSSEPETEKLLSDFLYHRMVTEAFPNLKHLHVKFTNVPCNDIFQYFRFKDFPPQVESLTLEYTFSTRTPGGGYGDPRIPRHMIETPHLVLGTPAWTLPSVRKLRIVGGYDRLEMITQMCPKIEQLSIEWVAFWDERIWQVIAYPIVFKRSFPSSECQLIRGGVR